MSHQSVCRAALPHGQRTNAPDQRRDVLPDCPTPARCVRAGAVGQEDDPARFSNGHRAGALLREARSLEAVAARSEQAPLRVVLEARDAVRSWELRSLLWRALGPWTDGRG